MSAAILLWIIFGAFAGWLIGCSLVWLIILGMPLCDELWYRINQLTYTITAPRRISGTADEPQRQRFAEVYQLPGIPAQDAVDGLARLHQVLRGSAKKESEGITDE